MAEPINVGHIFLIILIVDGKGINFFPTFSQSTQLSFVLGLSYMIISKIAQYISLTVTKYLQFPFIDIQRPSP